MIASCLELNCGPTFSSCAPIGTRCATGSARGYAAGQQGNRRPPWARLKVLPLNWLYGGRDRTKDVTNVPAKRTAEGAPKP
jgi:hypothetical protein